MASIDANLCSLSAEVRSFLSRTIEWPVMNVAADQDSTSNDSVQPFPVVIDLLSSSIRTARLSEVLFPGFEIPSW